MMVLFLAHGAILQPNVEGDPEDPTRFIDPTILQHAEHQSPRSSDLTSAHRLSFGPAYYHLRPRDDAPTAYIEVILYS